MSQPELFRYSSRPFPPYTYVPGSGTPHPVSDPQGHMYAVVEPFVEPLDPSRWYDSAAYLYAVDLFNNGYYWEAHEAWESLWHAAGHHGEIADFLKGLIKLAAAGVKFRESNAVGVERHLARARELLEGIKKSDFAGIDFAKLNQQLSQISINSGQDFRLAIALAPLPA